MNLVHNKRVEKVSNIQLGNFSRVIGTQKKTWDNIFPAEHCDFKEKGF